MDGLKRQYHKLSVAHPRCENDEGGVGGALCEILQLCNDTSRL